MMPKEEEISINLDKIKKFFKGSKTREKSSTDEVSIDFKKIKNFIIKNKTVFLILIPLFFAIFLRVYPAYLPITENWAEKSVYDYYGSQIKAQINQQYPNLPDKNKQVLINQQLEQIIKQNEAGVNEQIKQTAESFKSRFQDESGQTYLLAIDPYTYYRYTRNKVENGHVGDVLKDGEPYDNHMLAPIGRPTKTNLHIEIEYYLYKIIHTFNNNFSVMAAAFYVPVIIAALAIFPAFFIGRKISGNVGGFFASFLIAIHPAFLTRTAAGFSDTDAYNVLFPLLAVWLILKAFEFKDKKSYIYSGLTGLVLGLYSFAWDGWWYIFDVILAGVGAYIIFLVYKKIKEKQNVWKDINHSLLNFVTLLVSTGLFVTLFKNFNGFIQFLTGPFNFLIIKEAAKASLWPNVYTTVAELNKASLNSIINTMGGSLLFALGIIGIVALVIKAKKTKINFMYASLLTVWFIVALYASTKGIRFTLLLTPAYCLAFGAAVGLGSRYISNLMSKSLNIEKNISKIAIIILFSLLLIAPFNTAKATAKGEVPSMNDAWYNSLTAIKLESSEDAIINSWWDFGHWFKAIGDRAVTFDGASQNTPMAHWIGKTLLTSNENEAIGILRMLDCGSNSAFEELNRITNDTLKSVNILYEIVILDEYSARTTLLKYVPENKVDSILEYTHCDPPENYFITSSDMVQKGGVWAHFGSWDFTRAKIWREVKDMRHDEGVAYLTELNYPNPESTYFEVKSLTTEKEANQWISPWPGYASGLTQCRTGTNNTLTCGTVKINLATYETLLSTEQGLAAPYSLVYQNNNQLEEIKFEDAKVPYSVILIGQDGDYQIVVSSPELAKSMFTRLFFMEGYSANQFELFTKERQVTGGMIYVWKVKW
ncbi:STT3 domain-containing protein [Nanoarchaeota archaeon]